MSLSSVYLSEDRLAKHVTYKVCHFFMGAKVYFYHALRNLVYTFVIAGYFRVEALAMKANQNLTKRPIPGDEILDTRESYLHSLKAKSEFEGSFETAPLLEVGNSKLGIRSDHYDKVLVWNLPVVVTCPGASEWCLRHCYNADARKEKFPINEWNKNLQYYLNSMDALEEKLLNTLTEPGVRKAVRIHSSGDFFEKAYIEFWRRIVEKTPTVRYWAYTRSWQNKELIAPLEQFRLLNNIQLFASWDKTMPSVPQGWRQSIVYGVDEKVANTGIVCPEQSGTSPNCATCNYCITKSKGDVYFILH